MIEYRDVLRLHPTRSRAAARLQFTAQEKAAGRLCELRRSPFGGACDFSCCVKPQAEVDYTLRIVRSPCPCVKPVPRKPTTQVFNVWSDASTMPGDPLGPGRPV